MNKAFKRIVSIALSVLFVFTAVACGLTSTGAAEKEYRDNSDLVRPYVTDDKVTLDENGWPTWADDLIIAECRIEMAAATAEGRRDGTVQRMEPVLKHLAELGVSGLWVTPVEDKGDFLTNKDVSSTYCNYGVHTICPYITGQIPYGEPWYQTDYDKGREIIKEFVDLCHQYNIRIFFDKVPWGISKQAPMLNDADKASWWKGASSWGGIDWDYKNPDVIDFYTEKNLEFIRETGCDGIRWDLEPNYFSYADYEYMHKVLLEEGRKVLFFGEDQSFHGFGFAFSQFGDVLGTGAGSQFGADPFFNDVDIVKAVKITGEQIGHSLLRENGEGGQARYYTFQICSHDFMNYYDSSIAHWAYQYLYGSFNPLFYMGQEWGKKNVGGGVYGSTIFNFEEQLKDPKARAHYEEVKELISYRWKYKHIVCKTYENHRDTNICTVKLKGTTLVQGYARYAGNEGFIVIPNVNEDTDKPVEMTAAIPFADMEMDNYTTYTLKDIRTDKVIASGTMAELQTFKVTIPHMNVGLYHLVGEGKIEKPDETDENTDDDDEEYYEGDDALDTDDELEADDEEESKKVVTVKRRKKKASTNNFPWLPVSIGGVVLLAIIAAVIIIIARKRKA